MRRAMVLCFLVSAIMFIMLQVSATSEAFPHPPHPNVHVSWFGPWFPFWIPHQVIVFRGGNYGYLDLDVVPEEARVYIDGHLMGICDDFDGFPDYLYVESGKYTIRFSLEGYLDHEQEVLVKPGHELEFNTRLKPEPRVERSSTSETRPVEVTGSDQGTVFEEYDVGLTEQAPEPEQAVPATNPGTPASSEAAPVPSSEDKKDLTGFLRLRVFPREASIYLDGTFLGPARDLNDREEATQLSCGPHVIDMMMPGYETVRQSITVKEGETTQVRVVMIKQE